MSNRPPQPADRWFAEHQATCGGTYTKISAPEPTKKKPSAKSQKSSNAESEANVPSKEKSFMDNFFSVSKANSSSSSTSSKPPATLTTGQLTETSLSSSSQSSLSSVSEGGSSNSKTNGGNSSSSSGASQRLNREAVIIDLSANDTLEPQRLTPREAAAAAALARFENHLKTLDRNTSPPPLSATAQVASPSVLKRKILTALETTTPELSTRARKVKNTKTISDERPTEFKGKQQGSECAEAVTGSGGATTGLAGRCATSPTNHNQHSPSLPSSSPQSSPPVAPSVSSLVQCPICSKQVDEATINDHIDLCIWDTGKTD